MKKILLLALLCFSLLLHEINGQNAPVTIAPKMICNVGTIVDIPIKVTDFTNIGALSLTLEFDALVLDYQSYINDSGFPGLLIFEQTPGKITAGGYIQFGNPGINLNDSSVLFTLQFYCLEGSTELHWFDNGESCEYTDDQFNPLNDSPSCSFYSDGSVNESTFQIDLTVFLEGAYLNGEMTTELADLDLIPTSQPFSGPPWNYDGLESVSSIPDNVVDWVFIELRETNGDASTATADKVIAEQAGFLLKDGSVKNASDCSFHNLEFSVSFNDNLFVVVYHRNHIAVISSIPIPIFNGFGSYDFSSSESKAYGGNLGHKEIAENVWGLAAGDSNGDGNIDNLDKQNEWIVNIGKQGYFLSDFSFDSQTDNKDKNDFWNLNLGFSSRVP